MTDKVIAKCYDKDIVSHITPEYFNDLYYVENVGSNKYTFKLFNPQNTTSSYLTVICSHFNCLGHYKHFRIAGSIRKWWFGNMSVDDFTKSDYEAAIKYLFALLEIHICEARHFILSVIEVGLNINFRIPFPEIASRIVGYKNSCYTRISYAGTGICYETKTKSKFFRFYNKIEEIAKDFKNIRLKSFEEAKFLEDYEGENIQRIEFNLEKPSEIQKELGFNNIEDSIIHFDAFYSYFWKQMQHIQFSDVFIKMPAIESPINNYKDFQKHMAKIGIKISGVVYVYELIKQIKNGKARNRAKKFIKSDSGEINIYDKSAFLIAAKSQMLKSMHKSGCLFLVRKLFLNKSAA